MAKQSILTNKKILWTSAGVLLTSGILAGILVPVLTSKDDPKEKDTKLILTQAVLNAKTSDDTITTMQKLYGLEIKKASAVNDLEIGELKTKYQSASNLATFIFINKNSYQTLFVQGKEQTTNLQEIVLIMSPKNQVREQATTGNWPDNQVDAQDQFNFLITFFKGKVVKVRQLNAKTAVVNEAKIFFKTKAYDLVNLFYQFKNADLQANEFDYYNAYLDDKNNTQGLALFKKYLLTLKSEDSTVTDSDLTEVMFTKKSHNSATNKAVVELKFSYQGLSITKTINDFDYREIYDLTLKAGVANKMADEVESENINITNLPEGVSISSIEPSPDYTDGSVIKITFSGGTITSQNLPGLTSYQSKAQTLLENAQDSDFIITGQSQILPSAYTDKVALRNQLKAKANAIVNNNAKTKVKEILGRASITFNANDQTGALNFTITIGAIDNTFVISDLDTFNSINKVNRRIDAEVARRTKPTIKPGSEWKTGDFVKSEWESGTNKENIIISPKDNNLISKVLNIKVKEKGVTSELASSIIVVTIEVSSYIDGTKVKNYKVDLEGFVDFRSELNFNNLVARHKSPIKNNDFINLRNMNKLPNQIKDIDLTRSIKNIFQEKLNNKNAIQILLYKDKKNIDKLKKLVNNNMKITFVHNDQKGTIQFTTKLGSFQQTFTITGFKTSTSS